VLQASTNLQEGMVLARTALRASTGLLQDKLLRPRAWPAVQASIWWKQEDLLRHRARPASQASTGWKQEDPLRHRARYVPRTRPRLLRAVLKPHALVMQATVETPAQEYAQRA
jgi:hypothetical protein